MATETKNNVHLASDIYDLVNRNDLDHLSDLYADDVKLNSIPVGGVFEGKDHAIDYVRLFKRAFPDLNLSIQRQVVKDNFVINELIASGTHQGPFASPLGELPPTGKRAQIPVCEILEFRNGKLKSARQYWNAALLLGQLGALGSGSEQRIH